MGGDGCRYNPVVGGDDFENSAARRRDVIAVGDSDSPFYAPVALAAPVVDARSRERPVGNDYRFIVGGGDYRVENLNLGDGTREALCLALIADFVGLQKKNQNTSGEVLKSAAQSHAYGDTGRGENS